MRENRMPLAEKRVIPAPVKQGRPRQSAFFGLHGRTDLPNSARVAHFKEQRGRLLNRRRERARVWQMILKQTNASRGDLPSG